MLLCNSFWHTCGIVFVCECKWTNECRSLFEQLCYQAMQCRPVCRHQRCRPSCWQFQHRAWMPYPSSPSSPIHSMPSVHLFLLGLLCILLKCFRRFLFRWPFKDYMVPHLSWPHPWSGTMNCTPWMQTQTRFHVSSSRDTNFCPFVLFEQLAQVSLGISGWKLHQKLKFFFSSIVCQSGHWLWGQTADQNNWVFTFQIMFVIWIISVLTVIESNKRRLS